MNDFDTTATGPEDETTGNTNEETNEETGGLCCATYCPEDDKLRLYVGRVPRDEYDRLRAEGWQALHKQRETGGGDFAAVWTPGREDTALSYSPAGIDDEDKGPAERAADRAERFGGYADRRADEAGARADRYDAGPMIHGHQSAALAERRAARHDMQATKAVNLWDKAEYWQARTAGVIAHALHLSAPGVRMGRIKTLEAEQRKNAAKRERHAKQWEAWQAVARTEGAEIPMPRTADGELDFEAFNAAHRLAYAAANTGEYRVHILHPDEEVNENGRRVHGSYFHGFSADDFLTSGNSYGGGPFRQLSPKEYAELYLAKVTPPERYGMRWARHYEMRLAYEWQMLDAQGGRAAVVEMEPGGWLGNHQILKVNKSPATGRVVSVGVKVPQVSKWTYKTANVRGTDYAMMTIETERLTKNVYRAPTDEERAAFAAAKKAKPKGPAIINPTLADAERLQDLINRYEAARTRGHTYPTKPGEVRQMAQARYSGYCSEWRGMAEIGPAKLRIVTGNWQSARCLVVLTDKPQKTLPPEVFAVYESKLADMATPAKEA